MATDESPQTYPIRGGIRPAWASAIASRRRWGWRREGARYAAIPSLAFCDAGDELVVSSLGVAPFVTRRFEDMVVLF